MRPKRLNSRFTRENHGLWGGILADGFVEFRSGNAQITFGGINMERKSIGQFIAALRKSRGLTQAQLAEKLNVSDKAVSRWERDESAPDLSLIPVLAEIFGVTSDEILRGERISPENPVESKSADRPKKQMERLLSDAKTKFQVRSILSLGIGVFGLLAAMLCNFGFLRARIGFIVGCIFYAAAIGLESIFLVMGFYSVSHEDFEGPKLYGCKKQLIRLAGFTGSAIVAIFAASLPLVTLAWDAYIGITALTWLTRSIPYILIALIICGLIYFAADHYLLNRGVYGPVEKEKEIVRKKLRRRYVLILAVILLVTFTGQLAFNLVISGEDLAHAEVFYTPEDFINYMETPVDNDYYVNNGVMWIVEGILESDVESAQSEIPFYDSNGGERLYKYVMRNHTVALFMQERNRDGSTRCYKVYTGAALRQGSAALQFINTGWFLLYVLEAAVVSVLYFLKRRAPAKKQVDR